MTLDKIEKMAREIMTNHDQLAEFCTKTGNHLHTFPQEHLARALLVALPVVRTAEALKALDEDERGIIAQNRTVYDAVTALYDAIDQMRAEMGGES